MLANGVVVLVVWRLYITDNDTTLGLFCLAQGCGNIVKAVLIRDLKQTKAGHNRNMKTFKSNHKVLISLSKKTILVKLENETEAILTMGEICIR